MPMTPEEMRTNTLAKIKAAEKQAMDEVHKRVQMKQQELDRATRDMESAQSERKLMEDTLNREREENAMRVAALEQRVKEADAKTSDALLMRAAADDVAASVNSKATSFATAKAESEKELLMATQRASHSEEERKKAEQDAERQSQLAFEAEAKRSAEEEQRRQAEQETAQVPACSVFYC